MTKKASRARKAKRPRSIAMEINPATGKYWPRDPALRPDADAKSTSVRFLVTPEQVSLWNEAALLTHEGNLSMFARQTLDAAARMTIEKAKSAS